MPDTPELKPCPWKVYYNGPHKVEVDVIKGGTGLWFGYVFCPNCEMQGPAEKVGRKTREGAITAACAAWNSWGEKPGD